MSLVAIEGFRKWTAKRRRLLQGLIGVAVEGVASCVPGGGLAVWSTRILGEFAKHGVERLADTSADVPDVKPAGQSIPTEQLDQLNGWLASLSTSYADLLDRLDALVTLPAEEPDEQLPGLVRQALSQHADLMREFDAQTAEVRRQTLSLARIEERLDDIFHGQKGIALSLEEIKALILQSAPPPGEWEMLRQARPEAVRLLNEADAHFLAGRREEGVNKLLQLFNERGVGQATLCRRLGGAWLGEGKLKEAALCLQQVAGPNSRPPAAVTRTLTSITGAMTRGSPLPVWRSLPRGFVIEERWRIDSEVGRGGMASVYRAEGIDDINRGQTVAIKIPAPGLLDDASSRQRFIQEIQISQKLSRQRHPAIVETLGYVRLTDPHTQRPLYGLVLEFIDGLSLAQWLANHKERDRPVSIQEIRIILESVCAALEHAHGQKPPILHRDLKPHNVMVGRDKRIRLMDFGIARVLEDSRQTATHTVLGTWEYLPPEFLDPHYQPDVRSDVYLAANLLVELLTFHPQGNPERRFDCPQAWLELISDAMNRVMRKRPASIREFKDRLRAGLSPKQEAVTPKPKTDTPNATLGRNINAFHKDLDEELACALKTDTPSPNLTKDQPTSIRKERVRIYVLALELGMDSKDLVVLCRQNGIDVKSQLSSITPEEHDRIVEILQKKSGSESAPPDRRLRPYSEQVAILQRLIDSESAPPRPVPKLPEVAPPKPTLDPRSAIPEVQEKKQEAQQREIVNSIGMKLALVEPGVFLMGSSANEAERSDNEHPMVYLLHHRGIPPANEAERSEVEHQHEVEITQPLYAGIYPVTQEQYQRVMGVNPSWFSSTGRGKDKVKGMDTHLFPVESVSWEDAVEFCRRLSEQPKEKANERTYRLPTEAEWEYICRGGPFIKKPSSPFYFGSSLSSTQANFDGNFPYGGAAKGAYLERTSAVGCYPPNPLGLHDLHGNVWEWCADWYGGEYYKWSPRQDPQGPENGKHRVLRGGSWIDDGRLCRAACRGDGRTPGTRVGFRVVLVVGART